MTRINASIPRSTSLQRMDAFLANLRRTQNGMAIAQNQIQTGKAVERPSDAPAKTSAILLLQTALEARAQHKNNLSFATGLLSNVDQAMADVTTIAEESRSIGSSQIGIGSNADTRRNQATVIDAQIKAMVDIANRSYQGVSLFGGNYSPSGRNLFVFDEQLGGVRYVGARDNLAGDLGMDQPVDLNTNGVDSFNALSSRVVGDVDLNPAATAATRLTDVAGAGGVGVRKGALTLTVDGNVVTVDLTQAQALGDVVTRINDAINTIDPAAGTLALSATGFSLTANAAHTISIADTSTGKTAADLGIALTAAAATVAGGDIQPRLTERTTLASLGAGVDMASGMRITQGSVSKTLSLTGAVTLRDVMNRVNELNLGLRLEINPQSTGLQLVSEVSGPGFSIGEISGGTTAGDLGLRSYSLTTSLSDLNNGLGVSSAQGQDDFAIHLHNGASFNVNIDGADTVGDVVTAIRTAAQTALGAGNVGNPGDAGTLFNIGLAQDGNGLALEDGSAGGADFRVIQLGTSLSATDLGIYTSAGSGNSITGTDVATVRADGLFTHMIALRQALLQNDSRGITLATASLETDVEQLAKVHADVGVRGQQAEAQTRRLEDVKLTEETMLSELQDAEATDVITQYNQLLQQFQASLRVGAQSLQMSLLDFLQ